MTNPNTPGKVVFEIPASMLAQGPVTIDAKITVSLATPEITHAPALPSNSTEPQEREA